MAKINKSKRVTVQIPQGTAIHEFLSKNNNMSKWELLDQVVRQLPKSKEDRAVKLFENFAREMTELYPEKKESFEKLRPLVIRQIIRRCEGLDGQFNPLPPAYFEELKKI